MFIILRGFFRGPWDRWSTVPKDARQLLFAHFAGKYQWPNEETDQVYFAWRKAMGNRYDDMMRNVRQDATARYQAAEGSSGTVI